NNHLWILHRIPNRCCLFLYLTQGTQMPPQQQGNKIAKGMGTCFYQHKVWGYRILWYTNITSIIYPTLMVFSKIDVYSSYHQIKIWASDIPKTYLGIIHYTPRMKKNIPLTTCEIIHFLGHTLAVSHLIKDFDMDQILDMAHQSKFSIYLGNNEILLHEIPQTIIFYRGA
ncbi:hypothetical protein ACJX0J_015922, partial [Zea mays]